MTEKLCKQDPQEDTYLQAHAHTNRSFLSLLSLLSAQPQLGVALYVRRAVLCHVCVSLCPALSTAGGALCQFTEQQRRFCEGLTRPLCGRLWSLSTDAAKPFRPTVPKLHRSLCCRRRCCCCLSHHQHFVEPIQRKSRLLSDILPNVAQKLTLSEAQKKMLA